MSLQKAIVTQYGTEMTYWKITGVSIAYVAGLAIINLGGYLDVEAKIARLECIPKNIRVNENKFVQYFNETDMTNKDVREIAYIYIKENIDEFKDAIDV